MEVQDSFLPFLFLEGLRNKYPRWVEEYRIERAGFDQDKMSAALQPKKSLDVVICDFQCALPGLADQVMIFDSSRYVRRSKAGSRRQVIAPQPGAVEGINAEWVVQLVKKCTICHEHRHDANECTHRTQNEKHRSGKRKRQRRH